MDYWDDDRNDGACARDWGDDDHFVHPQIEGHTLHIMFKYYVSVTCACLCHTVQLMLCLALGGKSCHARPPAEAHTQANTVA